MLHYLRSLELAYWNLRARAQFRIRGVAWPQGLQVRGRLGLSAGGRIEIGKHVVINNDSKFNRAGINRPSQLVAAPDALLRIGSNVGISGGVLYATEMINVGNHVLIGANTSIYDSDFHTLDHIERRKCLKAASSPVFIEDDVWIGANAFVLKGVRIGARSVIGAGSIVTKNIPPDSIAAGNPARLLRKINDSVVTGTSD